MNNKNEILRVYISGKCCYGGNLGPPGSKWICTLEEFQIFLEGTNIKWKQEGEDFVHVYTFSIPV